jgi:hypothetical protein
MHAFKPRLPFDSRAGTRTAAAGGRTSRGAGHDTPSPVAAAEPTLGRTRLLAAKDLHDDGRWDDKLCRQVKSTVALFELLMGVKPFASCTQEDLASFKRKLRLLPKRYDMTSEKSRGSFWQQPRGSRPDYPQPSWGSLRQRSTGTSRRFASFKGGPERQASPLQCGHSKTSILGVEEEA